MHELCGSAVVGFGRSSSCNWVMGGIIISGLGVVLLCWSLVNEGRIS